MTAWRYCVAAPLSFLLAAIVFLTTVVFLPECAQAIVMRSGANESDYISLANNSAYSSVGRLDCSTQDAAFLASGTLIAPDWVLTAAHVFDHARKLSFSIGGETYVADRMIANPNWNGNVWSGYDIGLIHLSKPVKNVTPASLYTGTAELNQVDTTVGFGMTGNGASGGTKLDGQKRAAQNVINEIDHSRLLLSDFANPTSLDSTNPGPGTNSGLNSLDGLTVGIAKTLPLEGLIAPGDSGGGLFITTRNGTYLAGVNSFVGSDFGTPNSTYGDFSGHTRVSAFTNWIEGQLNDSPQMTPGGGSLLTSATGSLTGDASKNPDALSKVLTVAVPEPSSLALLVVAGLLLHLSRRIMRPRALK